MSCRHGGGGGGGGPCGACKFLRRKCVKNCVFAPYFDSDQLGTSDFAAVHRVFGASNAAKLLLRIPPHRRLDAVVSLCYEALSRVRDPVYGCVANIFTLQQQVINLQAELAYVRARISTLQCHRQANLPSTDILSSPKIMSSSTMSPVYSELAKSVQTSRVIPKCSNDTPTGQELEESDLEMIAREFLTKYVPRR
ncbi:LOB domain-containing protein 19-like [Cynara cardunculus var. scolymus]